MQILPVDLQNNLFYVEDYYPSSIMSRLSMLDLSDTPYQPALGHESRPRRELTIDNTILYKDMFDFSATTGAKEVSKALSMAIDFRTVKLWVDTDHYSITTHCDYEFIPVAMQLYLGTSSNLRMGTIFYNPDRTRRQEFLYRPNSGYLMINGPTQFHSADFVVPPNTFRLSGYHYFNLV